MTVTKRNFWIIWASVTIVSFIAFFVGIRFVLNSTVLARNIIAYLIVSLIFGAVSSALYLLKMKIANISFLIGILIGFFEMYRVFWSDLSGWEDLAGFMSMFLWTGIGLGVGVLAQLGRYFYLKFRSRENKE